MGWDEAHGTWLGVIGTDQHSQWSPKRSQWSKSGGYEVKVSEWHLALGMDLKMKPVAPRLGMKWKKAQSCPECVQCLDSGYMWVLDQKLELEFHIYPHLK